MGYRLSDTGKKVNKYLLESKHRLPVKSPSSKQINNVPCWHRTSENPLQLDPLKLSIQSRPEVLLSVTSNRGKLLIHYKSS